MSRRIVADMPPTQRDAYNEFVYAPVLWANVALNNSRALDNAKLNFLSTYLNGFGGLLLRYEKISATSADPERPSVLGVGCPLSYPGLSPREQEQRAQQELLETSFRDYETRIREDLSQGAGSLGFRPPSATSQRLRFTAGCSTDTSLAIQGFSPAASWSAHVSRSVASLSRTQIYINFRW